MSFSSLQSHQAPIYINSVELVVRDIEAMIAFYRDVIGLTVLSENAEVASLGAGENAFLRLTSDKNAVQRSAGVPGLFHTAFLLPRRGDLGAWLRHALNIQAPLEGLSDHNVSEAAYISDPEGNGVEIYWDRPKASWTTAEGTVEMGTLRMDVQAVLGEASKPLSGAYKVPLTTLVGHVHLSVGDLSEAGKIVSDVIGMKKKASYPQADFYASGDYHHHIAVNTWHLGQKKLYERGFTGLSRVVLEIPDLEQRQMHALHIQASGGKMEENMMLFNGPSDIPFSLKLSPTNNI